MLSDKDRALLKQARAALDNYLPTLREDAKGINDHAELIRPWKPGVYALGNLRRHGGVPYRCIQAHDSTANTDWTPDAAPSLWAHYHGTSPETARPFAEEGHNPYKTGEYCLENGATYRCVLDNAVWPPSQYPDAWEAC